MEILHLWNLHSARETCRVSVCVCVCALSHVQLSATPCSLPDSCPWDFLGKNTGVGCHFLLQGIFLIQESNSHLPCQQVDSLPLIHQENPGKIVKKQKRKQNICNIRYAIKEQKARKEGERNLGGG